MVAKKAAGKRPGAMTGRKPEPMYEDPRRRPRAGGQEADPRRAGADVGYVKKPKKKTK